MKCTTVFLAALLLSGLNTAHATVTVSGDVARPGSFDAGPDARLLTVITLAQPSAQSYWLGATWYHKPLLEQQLRLKAGVMFDLDVLLQGARLAGKKTRAELAARLYESLRQLPVTGRKVAVLDPVAIETGFARNALVADGDQLIYPFRPSTVSILGAVATPCVISYQPSQPPRDYLDTCPVLTDADQDYLWLIQPDGRVRKVGIALWNREDDVAIAPGSKIFVPIKNDDIKPPTPDLNQQLAEFFATQPIKEMVP